MINNKSGEYNEQSMLKACVAGITFTAALLGVALATFPSFARWLNGVEYTDNDTTKTSTQLSEMNAQNQNEDYNQR